MYLWDALLVLVRRWYLVVPLLILTMSGCVLATKVIAPVYEADASVLFLIPSTVEGPNARVNPYLNFGGANALADVVGRIVMSDTDRAKIGGSGGSGKYAVAMDPSTSAPLLNVKATAPTPGLAMRTRDIVIQDIQSQLSKIQSEAGSPVTALVYTQVLPSTGQAAELRGSVHRAFAAIAALGLVVTVSVPIIVEAVIRRQRLVRQANSVRRATRSRLVTTPDARDDDSAG